MIKLIFFDINWKRTCKFNLFSLSDPRFKDKWLSEGRIRHNCNYHSYLLFYNVLWYRWMNMFISRFGKKLSYDEICANERVQKKKWEHEWPLVFGGELAPTSVMIIPGMGSSQSKKRKKRECTNEMTEKTSERKSTRKQ